MLNFLSLHLFLKLPFRVPFSLVLTFLFLLDSVPPAFSQSGDKEGEPQSLLVPAEKIPPSPFLKAEEALKSFKLPPGFKMEIVASEPLVAAPVALQFDPDGRLWVLEMTGFMRTPDGEGENAPTGNLVILGDSDRDGRMDQRQVFLDKLVMPRAFLVLQDGVLLVEPPHLLFYKMENGKPGARTIVSTNYAAEADTILGKKANIEHAANSLFWAMDNWIYSANHRTRFKYKNGVFVSEQTIFRGQWGMSQDDHGRLVYNSNSDQLRLDWLPAEYLDRNPNHDAAGANVDPVKDQRVWPGRVTPGINRGYQKGMLNEDGRLAKFTAACGPVIYRGDNFPPEFYGNAFVCEPSANLVKRNILDLTGGVPLGRFAYIDQEFLTSTDERFRPVNAYTGPDGALYVVDMYHGIIQHRYFLTSYLRKQAESRGMDKTSGVGRIYRIVNQKPGPAPNLGSASVAGLVKALEHPNGWWRDTAQQLLVQKRDGRAVPRLEKLARSKASDASRVQALWTLHGLDALRPQLLAELIGNSTPPVKSTAARLHGMVKGDVKELLPAANDPSPSVKIQTALALGESKTSEAFEAMVDLALQMPEELYLREALMSGLSGRELDFFARLTGGAGYVEASPGKIEMLKALAKATVKSGASNDVLKLMTLLEKQNEWKQRTALEGLASLMPQPVKGKPLPAPKPLSLAASPALLEFLSKSTNNNGLASLAQQVSGLFSWPGKAVTPGAREVVPLTADQQKMFEEGRTLYNASCGACHQPTGLGQEGLGPPLAGSEWVLGSEKRLGLIVLNGVRGPIMVKGRKYELEMPGLFIFDDAQIASVMTYVRRAWEHNESAVSEEYVKKLRAEYSKREDAWTAEELEKIP